MVGDRDSAQRRRRWIGNIDDIDGLMVDDDVHCLQEGVMKVPGL
jgi:hypothetical protein